MSGASWPPPPDAPLLDSVVQAWRDSVFAPRRFYPQLGRDQPVAPSLWYYIAVGLIVSGIGLFWRMVLPAAQPSYLLSRMTGAAEPTNPLLDFLLSPLALLFSLLLTAGVVHLLLLLLRGADNGFATTLRVFCLAYGAQLAVVVPFVGGLIGAIWMLVLAIIGLREAHETTGGRAAAAVLLPAAVLILFGILAAMVMMAGSLSV